MSISLSIYYDRCTGILGLIYRTKDEETRKKERRLLFNIRWHTKPIALHVIA